MERDEISLLEEELIQLSVKSLLVVTDGKPTLCIVWTKKSYNPDSFRAQLKNYWNRWNEAQSDWWRLLFGSKWVLVLRSVIERILSMQLDPPLGECLDRKSKMGHSIKECIEVTLKVKDLPEDELPYSLALKEKLNLLGRESLKLGFVARKSMKQWSYTGANDENVAVQNKINEVSPFSRGRGGCQIDEDGSCGPNMKVDEVQSEVIRTIEDSHQNIKKSWRRLIKITTSRQNQLDGVHGKRKRTWEEFDRLGNFFQALRMEKRAKIVEKDSDDLMTIVIGRNSLEQDLASFYQGSTAAKRQADRA
ncbi:hypothetical protein Gotri_018960 [Gossypium trilobum]|uniref:Uncharacterized protein n=1 Tax=Gossypium trilobum TaxID=34281 RepID=A0A7J9ECP6_9ROSI|nr:hypothetical protein [Gossypium trilobum]